MQDKDQEAPSARTFNAITMPQPSTLLRALCTMACSLTLSVQASEPHNLFKAWIAHVKPTT